jgi:hypothetical protein
MSTPMSIDPHHPMAPPPDLPPGFPQELAAQFGDGPISATENPELATELSQKVIEGEKPVAREAPIGEVDLPGGWIAPDGTLCRTAMVHELTGLHEERLARINPATNYPSYVQTLLKSGLESINGHELDDEQMKTLLLGDRESLLLGIRIATYGPNLDMHLTCPACRHEEDLILELDKDIPVKEMDTPEVREYDVELRGGRLAVVRPATVGVLDSIWDVKKTGAEMKTATLQRCVKTLDGRNVAPQDILRLGLADRKTLLTFLHDIQPGPDYEGVRLACEECGEESALVLDLADLFQ